MASGGASYGMSPPLPSLSGRRALICVLHWCSPRNGGKVLPPRKGNHLLFYTHTRRIVNWVVPCRLTTVDASPGSNGNAGFEILIADSERRHCTPQYVTIV